MSGSFGATQTSTKTNGQQKPIFTKTGSTPTTWKTELQTPLRAAKETPKRVPKQTGTKMPSSEHSEKKLGTLKTVRFDTPVILQEFFGPHKRKASKMLEKFREKVHSSKRVN